MTRLQMTAGENPPAMVGNRRLRCDKISFGKAEVKRMAEHPRELEAEVSRLQKRMALIEQENSDLRAISEECTKVASCFDNPGIS